MINHSNGCDDKGNRLSELTEKEIEKAHTELEKQQKATGIIAAYDKYIYPERLVPRFETKPLIEKDKKENLDEAIKIAGPVSTFSLDMESYYRGYKEALDLIHIHAIRWNGPNTKIIKLLKAMLDTWNSK